MSSSLLAELQAQCNQAGLNLFGIVDAARFDAAQPAEGRARQLQPGCGTILVLGSGGSSFWRHMVSSHGPLRAPAPDYHPVQEFAVAQTRTAQALLSAQGIRSRLVQPEDRKTLNFVQLGEAAGFGTVSPVIHILLHPRFGPWISLRAALLLEGMPFGPIDDASLQDRFQPCCNCEKPCISACPVGVHDGFGASDFSRCAHHRHAGNCVTACSVRRACPVGAAERFVAEEEAHRHAYSLFAMQKWYGLGSWRFVPRFLRQ
ncbi:MAG: hypothetical protein IPK26_01260 [Planctomycetes bacterium]|nr:hypothetical protein [Planctomycetota bacterium]